MNNKEKIVEIIEKSREIADKDYREIDEKIETQKIIIKQAEMNLVQLEKQENLIRFYRNELEIIYNLLDEME